MEHKLAKQAIINFRKNVLRFSQNLTSGMYKSLENSDREVINIGNYLAADTWDIQMPLSNVDAGNYFEINIAIIKLL